MDGKFKGRNRLAVFEHLLPKEKISSSRVTRSSKRLRSPEPTYEENTTEQGNKRRKKLYASKSNFVFKCYYDECDYSINKYNDLLLHINEHLDDIAYARNDDEEDDEKFICLWLHCKVTCPNFNNLRQHLLYHGFFENIKAVGNMMLENLELPDCTIEFQYTFPIFPRKYSCEWDICRCEFDNYQSFLNHIKCHTNATPKSVKNKDDLIQCMWIGCTSMYQTQLRLREHVRVHTKEKMVACPSCGNTFASRTKFIDHRKRQLSADLQSYECSQCSKSFPSERLLRDHMRIHVNHYKCNLCDMTCPKPSSLAKHIRFRHLPDRLFKCSICNHTTVTAQDMDRHEKTHNSDFRMSCTLCSFKCRAQATIDRHMKKHEGACHRKYACHCCDKKFGSGSDLTKHLISKHDFHWPSGHSRFSYKQDVATGLYNLQLVRYESLEVTQEMIEGHVPNSVDTDQALDIVCEKQDKPRSFVLKIKEQNQGNGNNNTNVTLDGSPKKNKNTNTTSDVAPKKNKNNKKIEVQKQHKNDVVITIEQVDSKGNIIKIEKIEKTTILHASEIASENYKLIDKLQ